MAVPVFLFWIMQLEYVLLKNIFNQNLIFATVGGNPFAQPMTSPPFIGNPTLPRMISPSPGPFATTGPQIGPISIHQSMVTQSSTPQTSHQTLVTSATPLTPAAGPAASPAAPAAGASMLDVKDLFEKLVAVGIIKKEEKKEETTMSLEVAKPKEALAEIQQEMVEQKPLVPAVKPKVSILYSLIILSLWTTNRLLFILFRYVCFL